MAFSALRSWGTAWMTGGASEGGRLWEGGLPGEGWGVKCRDEEQEPESWGQWDLTEEEGGSTALATGTSK